MKCPKWPKMKKDKRVLGKQCPTIMEKGVISHQRESPKKKKKERKRDDIKGVGKKMEIGSRDGRWERR